MLRVISYLFTALFVCICKTINKFPHWVDFIFWYLTKILDAEVKLYLDDVQPCIAINLEGFLVEIKSEERVVQLFI